MREENQEEWRGWEGKRRIVGGLAGIVKGEDRRCAEKKVQGNREEWGGWQSKRRRRAARDCRRGGQAMCEEGLGNGSSGEVGRVREG